MAENKTKPTEVSVTAFVDAITDETKRADAKAILKLMRTATGEKPKMWGRNGIQPSSWLTYAYLVVSASHKL